MAKIVQNNLGQIIIDLNKLVYFGRIYSLAKIFVGFLRDQIYSDIHLSNIYGNKYIQIIICLKNYIRPTLVTCKQFFFTKCWS